MAAGAGSLPGALPPKPVRFDENALDKDELLKSFKQLLRAELNTFGSKYMTQPRRRKVRLDSQGSGVSGQDGCTSTGNDGLGAHAWVGRNIRSYAAAAELADLEGLNMVNLGSSQATPEKLLPDKIVKGTGPLSQRRRRVDSALSDGAAAQNGLAKGFNAVVPMRSESQIEQCRKQNHSQPLPPSSDATKQAWADQRRDRIPSYAMSLGSDESFVNGELSEAAAGIFPVSREPSGHQVFQAAYSKQPSLVATAIRNDMPCDVEGATGLDDSVPKDVIKDGMTLADVVAEESSRVSSGNAESEAPSTPQAALFKKMTTIYSLASSMFQPPANVDLERPSVMRIVIYKLVRSMYFENLTIMFILANALTIGIQTDHDARNARRHTPEWLVIVNKVIAVFFLLELLMRLFAFRRHFFKMVSWKWNILDLFVVGLQVFEEIMGMLQLEKSNMPIALSLLRMVRILRLIRIIRIVRLLRYMAELRTIVVSMQHSMKPLLSTIVLLALVVYIVGIYFTQITLDYRVENAGTQGAEDLEEYFGSVGTTVICLFQTVTGGLEWRRMLTPLMDHISPSMAIVFSLYIVFTSLALMNIVTGVFVETALQRGREDKDVYMINHLKDLFGALDQNQNGTISWQELILHLDDPKLLAFLKDIDIDISEAKGLFQLLDRDGSGNIDADEFLSGCLRLRGPAKALDLQLVMLELADQRRWFEKILMTSESDDSFS